MNETKRERLMLSVDVGDGWVASEAVLFEQSFIVLVKLVKQGQERLVRYDAGKRIFIDAAPMKLSADGALDLEQALQAA